MPPIIWVGIRDLFNPLLRHQGKDFICCLLVGDLRSGETSVDLFLFIICEVFQFHLQSSFEFITDM